MDLSSSCVIPVLEDQDSRGDEHGASDQREEEI
jgi:hypothetical protein